MVGHPRNDRQNLGYAGCPFKSIRPRLQSASRFTAGPLASVLIVLLPLLASLHAEERETCFPRHSRSGNLIHTRALSLQCLPRGKRNWRRDWEGAGCKVGAFLLFAPERAGAYPASGQYSVKVGSDRTNASYVPDGVTSAELGKSSSRMIARSGVLPRAMSERLQRAEALPEHQGVVNRRANGNGN